MSETEQRDTNLPRDHPREFYRIEPRSDGTVDVLLKPDTGLMFRGGLPTVEHTVIIVEGIEPWDGLEDDIRRRYDAWCVSGKRIKF